MGLFWALCYNNNNNENHYTSIGCDNIKPTAFYFVHKDKFYEMLA